MRLAARHPLAGIVLVAACHTDLGDAGERASGWYSDPWDWEAMVANVSIRVQFASRDDPLIPFETEQMFVHRHLKTELVTFEDRAHIWQSTFPELLEELQKRFIH